MRLFNIRCHAVIATSIAVVLFILCSWNKLYAQVGENLIRNWSFEEVRDTSITHPCPTSSGQIFKCKYWTSAYGTPSYLHACSNETYPNYGVPQNFRGWQQAYDGEAYASVVGYVHYDPGWDDTRIFLFHALEYPLHAGKQYRLDFRVSLADSCNFAMSGMGALLSVENTRDEQWQKEDFFASSPQVLNPWENLLDDKEGWALISGAFTAQGGEKYLSIGCFRSDADDNIQRVSDIPEGTYFWDYSSYYIDGVELYEERDIGIGEHEEAALRLYPNPAADVVRLGLSVDEAASVSIMDMTGREVLRTSAMEMDIGHLPSGIYTVSATLQNGTVRRARLVRQ